MSDSEDTWRLEHTTQGHNKFYEVCISHDGPSSTPYVVFTRHGKIGTGKGRTLEVAKKTTEAAAKSLVQEIISNKIAKGYKQVKVQKATPPKPKEVINSRFSRIEVE